MMKDNKKINHSHAEAGSAILWVLMAVALFAALNFAFNSGSRVSTSNLTDSEATAYANQIIQYGNEVKSAVKRMQLRGCRDTEISFENNVVAGYTNPNSPTDKSCHVFDIAGGGLTFNIFNENAFIESPFNNREPQFKGAIQIDGVGTSESDLHMVVHDLKQGVCLKINNILSITNPSGEAPEDGNDINSIFTGTYSPTAGDGIGDDAGSGLSGEKKFCRDTDTSAIKFHQYATVLIAR